MEENNSTRTGRMILVAQGDTTDAEAEWKLPCCGLGMIPWLWFCFHSFHVVSFVSMVDFVKIICLQDFHGTTPPLGRNTYPLVASKTSASEIQLASQ
jgi:hypothetical protein